jgi:hypothetical protein
MAGTKAPPPATTLSLTTLSIMTPGSLGLFSRLSIKVYSAAVYCVLLCIRKLYNLNLSL